ncbi:MAG: hypothetical protein QG602_304 [Verrucomicrobiota bacterium]|nr:hypothetical protein [Verrucomicrobiota bacterium]
MRWLLLSAVLFAGPVRGAETSSPAMREKLRARIAGTVAPLPATGAAGEKSEAEEQVLVLEPIVVTESRGVRELAKALADAKERLAAERFTATKGGTIYRSERVEVGSWYSPATGWRFLKFKW